MEIFIGEKVTSIDGRSVVQKVKKNQMIFHECDKSIHSEPIVCEAGELKIINNTLVICSQGEWYTLWRYKQLDSGSGQGS